MPYKKIVICTPFGMITSGRDGRTKSLSVSRVKLLAGGYKRKLSLICERVCVDQSINFFKTNNALFLSPYAMLDIIHLSSLIIVQWSWYSLHLVNQTLLAILIASKFVCYPLSSGIKCLISHYNSATAPTLV
jgi:hypothetical protein